MSVLQLLTGAFIGIATFEVWPSRWKWFWWSRSAALLTAFGLSYCVGRFL